MITALMVSAISMYAPDVVAGGVAFATRVRMAHDEKEMADYFYQQRQTEKAIDLYLHALELAPEAFSYYEKNEIAKRLIATGKQHDALNLLRKLVAKPHKDFAAEVLLAKLLTSLGEYDEAVDEVNGILKHDRKNNSALLLKGNVMRRRKAFGDALDSYRAILERGEDFDARLGLIYCLLAIGRKQEAVKQFKLLHAQDEWQQADQDELARNIAVRVRPVVEYTKTVFSDTDGNRGVEQGVSASGNLADWDLSLSALRRTAEGEGISVSADTYAVRLGTNLAASTRVSLGIGNTTLELPEGTKSIPIVDFQLDNQIFNGSMRLAYTSDVLTSNAVLISNDVGISRAEIAYSTPLSKSITIKTSYKDTDYSDHNTSQDFEGLGFVVLNNGAPQFSLGYGFRSLNFRRSSSLGYFDPQDYLAHKAIMLAAYENGSFYLYADYTAGRQTYTSKLNAQDDGFSHVGGTMGMTLFGGLRAELNAEKNNSSASTTDYEYGDTSFNLRLSYSL